MHLLVMSNVADKYSDWQNTLHILCSIIGFCVDSPKVR